MLKDRNTECKGLPWRIAVCKPEAFNHSSRLPKELQKNRKISNQRSKLIVKISKIAVFVTRIRHLKGIYIYKI